MVDSHAYTVVSVFSGAGGFDWGFHRTGRFKTILACEKKSEPADTLARNLGLDLISIKSTYTPNTIDKPVVIHGDICLLDFSKLQTQPDVIIGGPPCQDFSQLLSIKGNNRPGLNGVRGQLYNQFIRAVMFLQPKIFVFENVPGLLSTNSKSIYQKILYDLRNLEIRRVEAIDKENDITVPAKSIEGYEIIYNNIVDARSIGVPQYRKRLIIIGIRRDLLNRFCIQEQQEISRSIKSYLDGEDSLLSRFPLTIMEVFEGKPIPELQIKYKIVMSAYERLASQSNSPKAAAWRKSVWNKLIIDDIKHDYFFINNIENTDINSQDYTKAMSVHRQLLSDYGWLNKPINKCRFNDKTHLRPHNKSAVVNRMLHIPPGENYEFVSGTRWKVEGNGISFIYKRSAPLKPAWTVMAYGGGGTYGYHYEWKRAQLTLRERARIQTFTDDFLFLGHDIRAQIGEAVPPLLGQRIAEHILPILDKIE